jgi:hypothetical protein
MATCQKNSDNELEDNFTRFAKTLLKSFILISGMLFLIILKNQTLKEKFTPFNVALFIVLATVILSIVGLMDSYVFNNIAIGMGIAIGMDVMKF